MGVRGDRSAVCDLGDQPGRRGRQLAARGTRHVAVATSVDHDVLGRVLGRELDHPYAFEAQFSGDTFADPLTTTGDDGNLAVEAKEIACKSRFE